MEVFEILLIILCSVFGTGLIVSTVGLFYFKNKLKEKKNLREEKMAAKLYERLLNEEDEKLRKEIEDAIDEFNSESFVDAKHSKNISDERKNDDVLYAKCVSFVAKMTKSANYFLEQLEENETQVNKFASFFDNKFDKTHSDKYKTQVGDISNKVFDFLAKNKNNINKIQKMKDIWNSE